MALGGFLDTVLRHNPEATAHAYSLPVEEGEHEVLLPNAYAVKIRPVYITLLAEDLGLREVPKEHPDATKSLSKQSKKTPCAL